MLTRLGVKNFKRFPDIDIELGRSVVLIGPNNSGKTSVLQALALWDLGLRQWYGKKSGKKSQLKRPGVTINRRDIASIPIPVSNLLWRNLHVRDSRMEDKKQKTRNVRIDITVDGIVEDQAWSCGLEFDYTNEESFVCRPLRKPGFEESQVGHTEFSEIPDCAKETRIAFLPPMSGLSDREHLKQEGEINFLIGQGQTAQVLRNLCYNIFMGPDRAPWDAVKKHVLDLFGAKILDPVYIKERSELILEYEENGIKLDLSCSGRGLQQTLLLLAHLYANPNTVLLLDEPDAHLEILRQRQIYDLLSEVGNEQGAQIVAASHSEVVLNEAAGRGVVIAFVGTPHTMNDQPSQVLKSLNSIGWDQYYQAEEKGWVLYLEGPSDLDILQEFAKKLGHPVVEELASPFVKYLATNIPNNAREHFFGLREAKPDLRGIAVFDRLDVELHTQSELREFMWRRREIENYFCSEDVLLAYATHHQPNDLFGKAESERRESAMRNAISKVTEFLKLDNKNPWSDDVKASDEVLDRIFKAFFEELDLPLAFRKSNYHQLATLMSPESIDPEISDKLDAILSVAKTATPRRN